MKNLLIDGNSLINRAFYALPVLSTADGVYTNGIYGFLKMMYRAIDDFCPDRVICAFDIKKPTFRHERFPEYKAGRKKMPEELVPQIPLLQEILRQLGVYCASVEGFEADDIIGTYSRMGDENGDETVIITGDRDSFQLVSGNTSVWFTKKGISEILALTPENLKENYGVDALHVCDLKALMGDSSDNIPGVPGVGEKTALKLLNDYGSLDGVFLHENEIAGKLGEKIRAGRASAYESRFLAEIVRNAPVENIKNIEYVPADNEKAAEIFNKYQLKSLLDRVDGKEEIFGFETKDFDEFVFSGDTLAVLERENEILVAPDTKTQYRISLTVDLLSNGMSREAATEALRPFMENEKISKYFYDSKSAMHTFGKIKNIAGDIMLAEYLIDAGSENVSYEGVLKRYNVSDGACALLYAHSKQEKMLEKRNLTALYRNVELPLARVLYDMEITGFYVDTAVLRKLGSEFQTRIDELSKEIFIMAGKQFNLNSPFQLGEVLFEDMGLPSKKKNRRGYSTDTDVLESIDHPIIPLITEYRQLQKLKSTYIDAMFALISPKTGRIHTTFKQAVTATGRLSSAEPNLQNIPVRYEAGRNIRKAFLPEKEGYVLVNGDYSQIELRILAHVSGDPTLIKSFVSGEDIHARTAAEVFGVDIKDVTKEQRSRAKAVNFGIIYGIGDFGLAKNINSTRREAAEFIEKYLDRYPLVKKYMEDSVKEAKAKGYAETIMGRRRELPQLRAQNFNVRSFGERAAMNTPIQGSAADIIKMAMLNVEKKLKENPDLGKMILQVHDELIIEVKEEFSGACAEMLKNEMEHVAALKVPLLVDTNTGRTWFELK